MTALILRKLRSMRRAGYFTLFWMPFIVLGLGLARAAILVFTFKRLAPILGTKLQTLTATVEVTPLQLDRAVKISKAINIGARNVPWLANCFPQAIVARLMLGLYRTPYVLNFGLRRDATTNDLLAHAWVTSGERIVTGKVGDTIFTPVACYSNSASVKI